MVDEEQGKRNFHAKVKEKLRAISSKKIEIRVIWRLKNEKPTVSKYTEKGARNGCVEEVAPELKKHKKRKEIQLYPYRADQNNLRVSC
jgi:hypothetical protein